MPRGSNGEKRPGDTVGCAVHAMKIATGEIEEVLPSKRRKGGLAGGPNRSKSLTRERRTEIANQGAKTRWGK